MAKQNKDNKHENEELDLILERLMKSFNEDETFASEEENSSDPDDNAEFNQMLQQIIMGAESPFGAAESKAISSLPESSDDEIEFDVSEFYEDDEEIDDIVEETTVEDNPTDEPELVHEETTFEDETIIADDVITENKAPSLYEKSTDENQSECDVDNVLQLMFASNPQPQQASIDLTDENQMLEDEIVEDEIVEDEIVEDEIVEDEIVEDEIVEDEIVENEIVEDEIVEDEIVEDEIVEDEIVEDEITEYEPVVEDEEYFDEPEDLCENIDEEPARLILDPAQYTYDPLQNSLPDFSHAIVTDNKDTATSTMSAPTSNIKLESDDKNSLDSNDISLLLKFGYGEEVKSRIGEAEAQIAIAENDGGYVPESHKIPHGFCGKELTDKKDVRRIRDKYKSDRTTIIVQLVLVSILALVSIALEGFFEFFSDRSSYLAVCAAEMVLVAVATATIYKKIISGIIGIARFEANLYSVLAFLICSFAFCNVVTAVVYLTKSPSVETSGLTVFGTCILTYAILTLIAELMNCIRESNAFELMCRSDDFYTAEKHQKRNAEKSSARVGSSNEDNAYRLIRTSLVSGYFKKSSNGISSNVNLIYIIGIVPILSLIIGCMSAIIGGDVMHGISSMMITTLLCIPFVYIIIPSATEYISSNFFKSKKIAFIGKSSAEDLARADALYFDDTNSIEIISYTEIHPSKSVDSENDLKIARKVFRSLDGPLGEHSRKLDDNDMGDKGEVIINSIVDNGIDIYFDSSINILIGDKSYMLAHNIKVKTDSNLNTAIKGFDRSIIYMAFDGVPKLGFIITSKINPSFASIVSALYQNKIRACVDTYEPQINDTYFEQNKQANTPSISVYKSEEYESTDYKPICDGSVICASDCFALAQAVIECRNIVRRRKKNQRTHIALIVTGFVLSCLLALLINISRDIFILSALKYHISLIINTIMLASLTPGIVGIVKMAKSLRKNSETTKETK